MRKKPKNAICGPRLGQLSVSAAMCQTICGMNRDITDVNFDEIMDQQHLDHAVEINLWFGLIGQNESVKGQVPRMFARVFRT